MFLVMGITGKVGGSTAEHLLAQGKKVRALVLSLYFQRRLARLDQTNFFSEDNQRHLERKRVDLTKVTPSAITYCYPVRDSLIVSLR